MNLSRKMKSSLLWAATLLLCSLPSSATAEPFFDLYFGRAQIADETVSASFQQGSFLFGGPRSEVSRRTSFDSSNVFGLRGGYWFDGYPWLGAALDLSHFEAKGEGVDIEVVPLSALLMFRYPLAVSQTFPQGRLQPYAGLGISSAWARFRLDFRPEIPEEISENGHGIGPDFRAGLAWHLSERVAVFGEFRHWQAELEVEDEASILDIFGATLEGARADIRTNQILGGLSFRF